MNETWGRSRRSTFIRALAAWMRTAGTIACATLWLQACGGGGGSADGQANALPAAVQGVATAETACAAANTPVTIEADAAVTTGQTASAVVIGCTTSITNVRWTQTAGPTVTLLSDRTQAIAFEPAEAGTYAFRATVIDGTGATRTLDATIPVAANTQSTRVNARVDQAVRMGGTASFRAWPSLDVGDSVKTTEWVQTGGPNVTTTNGSPSLLLVTTPAVTRDEIVTFRVTIRTTNGATASDDVRLVIEKFDQASPGGVFSGAHVARVHPYRSAGRHAGQLVPCTFDPALRTSSASGSTLCPLSRLPLLAQQAVLANPTVEEILDRVAVSHDWMGANFEQFLRTFDVSGDLRRMFASVSAIIIGAHVRPSFYRSGTAAIYLDARYFWLTPEQRDIVDETPDRRDVLDDSLRFQDPSWYTRGNAFVPFAPTSPGRVSRTLADMQPPLARLLYHELAHALDFQPPRVYGLLNNAVSAFENFQRRTNDQPSKLLSELAPLLSSELRALARVEFGTTTPLTPATTAQQQYSGTVVGTWFAADRANDMYSFAAAPEDLAMLIEEFMMIFRHGIRRNVAFVDVEPGQNFVWTSVVRWGQRGRVADPLVKPRLRFAVTEVLPWINPVAVDTLPAPIPMRANFTALENLALDPTADAQADLSADALPSLPVDTRHRLSAE